ncbi:MAG: 50S ribosomal protein L22 [Patescibacteria group bacterium]|nr:50S ribosomal protein L22 [Patescibacteria group bacterium]
MAEDKDKLNITEATAKLGDLHISPRKVRAVSDLIRGKTFNEAVKVLTFISKKSAKPLLKLLNSAAANARNNFQLEPEKMWITKITVDTGRVSRRYKPRAQGRAFPINRRMSVVNLTLSADGKAGAARKKTVKSAKPDKK